MNKPNGTDNTHTMAAKGKQTQMAQEAQQESAEDRAARMAARTYVADASAWDREQGMEFGGQADILELEIGEVAGPFTYVGHQPMVLQGRNLTVHIGTDPQGNNLRLPISASFVRAADQAGLDRGDTFLVRRNDDVKKAEGVGKGTDMKIYSLKVVSRSTPTAAAS
jgi:hypothetical protein